MNGTEDFTYSIIKCARRRTLGIVIDADGNVEVRIPMRVTYAEAEAFVSERYDWIIKSRRKMLERRQWHEAKNWEQIKAMTQPWMQGRGGELFRAKVDGWAEKLGVDYNRLTVRDISTRWGSCSSRKNLSFSWKVFVMPERMVDYLVVHELAHLRYMNHSQDFWNLVKTFIPECREIKKHFEEYV